MMKKNMMLNMMQKKNMINNDNIMMDMMQKKNITMMLMIMKKMLMMKKLIVMVMMTLCVGLWHKNRTAILRLPHFSTVVHLPEASRCRI